MIPSLRGKYRSRRMEDVLVEAKHLADAGVKECIVIAQDITRYGIDLYGEKKLAALLRELCKLDFRWIRLHYLYPDEFTDELIDTIAAEEKVLPYLDIPIQHCNDRVLKAMNRRGDKAELLALFRKLRERIPSLVLRTSLITGLPFEDEAAFEELCEFLQEVRIERAGVFPYSPEEGTPAARMLNRVDTAEAERRAELVVDVQSRIMDDFNDSRMGTVAEVLCDGFDQEAMQFVGRSYAESPDIDGRIYFTADHEVEAGEFGAGAYHRHHGRRADRRTGGVKGGFPFARHCAIMLREIKAKGGYIYDYGEQTDDPAGADDPCVSGGAVLGLSR